LCVAGAEGRGCGWGALAPVPTGAGIVTDVGSRSPIESLLWIFHRALCPRTEAGQHARSLGALLLTSCMHAMLPPTFGPTAPTLHACHAAMARLRAEPHKHASNPGHQVPLSNALSPGAPHSCVQPACLAGCVREQHDDIIHQHVVGHTQGVLRASHMHPAFIAAARHPQDTPGDQVYWSRQNVTRSCRFSFV
jgi:hypothetical protein